jgi:hypothetical protein
VVYGSNLIQSLHVLSLLDPYELPYMIYGHLSDGGYRGMVRHDKCMCLPLCGDVYRYMLCARNIRYLVQWLGLDIMIHYACLSMS